MASDWEEVTLGSLVDFTPKRTIKKGAIAPFVSMADVTENSKFITKVFEKEFTGGGSRFVNGDTLFARITPCLQNGKCSKVSGVKDNEIGHGSTEFIIMAAKAPEYDEDYIYYLARLPKFRAYAESRMIGSTGRQRVSWQDLEEYEFYAPIANERKQIGSFLSSLDDKIELNRQMNETLEAMAQALFESWFVDFDLVIDNVLAAGNAIPDEFIERAEQRKAIERKDNLEIQSLFPDEFEFTEEMGWIPKGWEVKRIKDIGRVVTGKTPPKKIDNAYSEDGTPFITPTDIDDLPFVVYTNRYLSEDGVKAVKNSRISAGSICVTCIGSQMGKTTISPFASVSNQQINSITDCNQFWRNYLFFNLRRRREEIFLLGSSGSTMPILNKSNFEAVPILCPSEQLLSSLDSNFQSTIDSILENTKQNQTLAKLRDTLLPQLMSGELRIPVDIL